MGTLCLSHFRGDLCSLLLPWLTCAPSSMTSNPMACQAGQLKSTLSLLTSPTCQPWDCVPPLSRLVSHVQPGAAEPGWVSCAPPSMAVLCRPDRPKGVRLGMLHPLFDGWPQKGQSGPGEPGWQSCIPLFFGSSSLGWSFPGVLGHGSSPPSSMGCLCALFHDWPCQGLPARRTCRHSSMLASVGLPALELCVPFFTADLPMSDQVLQTRLGKLCPALQWMTSQGWTGSGEPGQGSCPPFFHGWPLQGQTSPNETVRGSSAPHFNGCPLQSQIGSGE